MLKKKALTAVLTAAFVLGIGGMVTDSLGIHEHGQGETSIINRLFEPAVAHAVNPNGGVAYWRCYWCGIKATSTAQPGRPAYPPNRKGYSACNRAIDDRPVYYGVTGWHYGHGWVHTGGAAPVEKDKLILYCGQCKLIHIRRPNEDIPSWDNCPMGTRNKAHPGKHTWIYTNITLDAQ